MTKRNFHFFKLEDRVLLSGEGFDGGDINPDADTVDELQAEVDLLQAEIDAIEAGVLAAAGEATPEAARETEHVAELYDPASGAPTRDPAHPIEVIFVDEGVADSETLMEHLRGGDTDTQWLVVRLSSDENGIDQITGALAELSSVDAIHLISHGNGDHIQLGNTELNQDSSLHYASDIASWGHALDSDGDILIYGCDLASTEAGQDLIDMIALVTNADVAASDNATGHEDLGGDWILEYSVGDVETDIAFGYAAQASWRGTLDITSNLVVHHEYDTSGSLTETDASGSGNDGTWVNDPAWTSDAAVGEYAMDFSQDGSGANAVVEIADDPSLDFSGDFTVSFWYNADVLQADATRLIGSHDGSDGFSIYTSPDGSLNFLLQGSTTSSTSWVASGFVADGNWHHVTATRSGNDLRLCVDGTSSGPTTSDVGVVDVNSTVTIGGSSVAGNDYEGKLDDVRIYTRAISDNDLDVLMAKGASIQVDTFADTVDGTTTDVATLLANRGADGQISLREAILAAQNDSDSGWAIQLSSGTYTLDATGIGNASAATGDFDITDNVIIVGSGAGDTILDASGLGDRVFDVDASGELTLQQLSVVDSTTSNEQGGGVRNAGMFAASDVVFSGHTVSNADGAAILSSGTMTLDRVSIVGNSADNGAVYVTGGTSTLTNVTISGNVAQHDAGGIRMGGGVLNINHSTIANNTATSGYGGGLRVDSGTANLSNSIFADNTSNFGGSDIDGTIVSGGYNIIEHNSGFSGTVGTDILGSDPSLAALSVDTTSGQYIHAINSGSIAYNAATGSSATEDQRGVARDANADIGAYEYIPPPQLLARYDFDSGSAATDSSGNGYDGTLQGDASVDTTTNTNQVGDGKLTLDGSGDYVDLSANANTFSTLSEGTVATWVKFSTTGFATIFDVSSGSANEFASLWVENGNVVWAITTGGSPQLRMTSTATINDDQWHHVAVTSDASGNTLYIDGVAQTGSDIVYSNGDASTDVFFDDLTGVTSAKIGAYDIGSVGGEFTGLIDDTRIYNYALSDTDLTDLAVINHGTAIWRNSGDTTPDVNDWDGTEFLGTGDSSSIGEFRIIEAAEAPTRDEIIVVGMSTIGQIAGEIWDGSTWSALPFSMDFSASLTEQDFDVVYESASGNAMLVWNNGDGGTASVSYRIWDGTTWSGEQTITAPDAGIATQIRLEANPTSDEIVLVVSDDNTDEWAAVWDGSSWGNTVVLDTTTPGDGTDIAVAFESQSGRAMVVYDGSTNYNDLTYRTWDGSTWSSQQTLVLPYNPSAETDVNFTSIASDATSDRIAIGAVAGGEESQVVFAVWDGSAWGNQTVGSLTASTGSSSVAAVGFESQSGDLLAVYSEAATTPRYQTWTAGGGWSGELSLPDIGASASTMMLVSDPVTNSLMLAAQDSDSDLHYIEWDGTAWGVDNELSTDTAETNQLRPFTFVYNSVAAPVDPVPSDLETTSSSHGGLNINDDGGNDIYLFADDGSSILGGLSALSYEVQFESNDADGGVPLLSYATDAASNEALFYISTDGNLQLTIGNSSAYSDAMDYRDLLNGQTHSMGFTWDGATGEWVFYVDGEVVDSRAIAGDSLLRQGSSIASGGELVFGQEQDSVEGTYQLDQVFSGTLFNARIFGDVRTDAEMGASYQTDLPYDESGMLAQWNFNELSRDGVITESVSGNNLTVKHTTESGFTASEASLTFSVDENALDGTVVGQVSGVDAEREAKIASLLAADTDLRYSSETEAFYKLIQTPSTHADATTGAGALLETIAGQLVTIKSAAEQDFVYQIAQEGSADVWLGASDTAVEGEWVWVDDIANPFWTAAGTTGFSPDAQYTNFATNEPNDSGDDGSDVLTLGIASGDWFDKAGGELQNYIVEWDADAVLDATNALTYSIHSPTVAGVFAIDASTGTITVADGSLLDYETNATHSMTVRVTDGESNTYDEVFTVELNDLVESNNAPTDLSSGIELNTDGGNDSYLFLTDGRPVLGDLTQLTLEATFQIDSVPTGTIPIIDYQEGGISTDFGISINPDGSLQIVIDDDAPESTTGTYAQLLDGDQHHIAVSWDNTYGNVRFYIDGQYAESITGVGTGHTLYNGATTQLILGQDADDGGDVYIANVFSGTLRDVRIWNEVRSTPEISLNYQNNFDSGSLPNGLVANWQMDGFNGSDEVVDVVSGNNLSVGHGTGPGLTASTPVSTLHIDENADDGTTVGYVVPSDPDSVTDVVDDGLFLEAADPGVYTRYTTVDPLGNWTVESGNVDLLGSVIPATDLGGRSVELNGDTAGVISQSLTTVAGQQYQVTFEAGGNFSGSDDHVDFRVSAGGTIKDITITEPDGWSFSNPQSNHYTLTFTATSDTTVLRFEALNTGAYGGVVADIQVLETPSTITTILHNDPTLTYDASTNKFYRYVSTADQFSTAIANAQASSINGIGGQLVTVLSAYENSLVQSILSGDAWLGGSDQTTEGDWRWIDGSNDGDAFWSGGGGGSQVSGAYSNFSTPAEPDNETSLIAAGEDAVAMGSVSGEWYDWADDSSATLEYVIEWDASEVLSNFTFSLTDDAGGRFAIDANTGELTVADGSLVDYETATSHDIEVQTTDAAGSSYAETMSITVDNERDANHTVPGPQFILENQTLTFSSGGGNAVTVSYTLGGTNSDMQVSLLVNNGVLTLSQTTGLVFVDGTNASGSFVINGTESAINAALEGMTFTPNTGFSGEVTLNVSTSLSVDLEGQYTFDDGTADDHSAGTADNGTLNGNAAIVTDPDRGEVLSLDGAGDFVRITGLMGNPADVTLSAWINADSVDSLGSSVISMGTSPALYLDTDGTLIGYYESGGTNNVVQSTESLVGTGWRHIAVSIDAANSMTIYIDGEAVDTTTPVGLIEYDNSPDTFIGGAGDGLGGFDFDGMIDNVCVYNRALAADEISALASDSAEVTDTVEISVLDQLVTTSTTGGGLNINDDGGNDTYLIADDGGTLLGGRETLSYEIRFATNESSGFVTLLSYATATEENELVFIIEPGGDLQLVLGGNKISVPNTTFDFDSLRDGTEHTLGFTWDGRVAANGTWRIFVDGVSVANGTGVNSGNAIASGGELLFGQEQDEVEGSFSTNQAFQGTLYDARFFSTIRTTSEIAASYRSDLRRDETGMIANWKFDELSTGGVITESVSGNNLTLKHTTEAGFSDSNATLTFGLDENSNDGTVIGSVAGNDIEREQQVQTLLDANDDLHYNEATGKFYKVVAGDFHWDVARTAAESSLLSGTNGQLAVIRSAAENVYITDIANDITGGTSVWLGGTDGTVEGEWRWIESGNEADLFWDGAADGYAAGNYSNWLDGSQPNDLGGNEDAIRLNSSTGLWYDAPTENSNHNYVIEWNADEVLDANQVITYAINAQTVAGAFAIDASTGQITVADGSLLDFETAGAQTLTIRTTDVDSNTYDEDFTISLNDLAEENEAVSNLSSGIELNTDGGNDAYLFDSTSGAPYLDGLEAFTMEFLVSDVETPETMSTFYSKKAAGSESYFGIEADGTLNWTNFRSVQTYSQIFDGEQHSVAFSWNATIGQLQFFVDGDLVETISTPTQSQTNGGGTFVLGQDQDSVGGTFDPSQTFSGTFHDVRVWGEARTANEIESNYDRKFDTSSLPSTLLANWQMDGFNGSNEVVDVVSGNNLSVGHATDAGFTTSTPVDDLHVSENADGGTVVGYVTPSAPDLNNDVASDGRFIESAAPGDFTLYNEGESFGGWTVRSGNIEVIGSYYESSPTGGRSVDLNGSTSTGAIYQTLDTTAGQQYQVTFELSGGFLVGDAVKDIRVSAGGQSQDFSIAEPNGWSGSNMLWESRSFTFTAGSSSVDLDFTSLDPANNEGAVIADIRVIAIPPAVTTILKNDPTLSYDASTGKFYKLSSSVQNWTTANSNAQADLLNGISGSLATIRSAYENELLRNMLSSNGQLTAWLGGSDSDTEGSWEWQDGSDDIFYSGSSATQGSYANFRSNQPDGGVAENYIRLWASDGGWSDLTESGSQHYFVEWDASEVLSNFTFSLTDDAGGRFAIDSNTGEITVVDDSLIDYESATTHDIDIQVTDAGGNSYAETMAITVDNALDANQTVPAAQSIDEDTSLTFTNGTAIEVSVTDSLGGTDSPMRVTLSVNDGVLNLSQTAGLTFIEGTDGSGSLVIDGSESHINAALDGMTFTPDADFNGSVTLNMTTALAVDLAGHYTFEGNADDVSAGTSDDGTPTTPGLFVSDPERGNVLSLNNSDYVEISGMFGNPADVTLAAWVNVNSGTYANEIISLGDNVTLRSTDGANGLRLFIRGTSYWQDVNTNINISDAGWTHVAATVNDTTGEIAIYINGELVASDTAAESIQYTQGTNTRIGENGNGFTSPMDGLIDEARVYTRALSADEIAALANDQNETSDSVAITVDPVNDAPVATNANDTATEDGSIVNGTLTVTDDDPGDSHTFALLTQPSEGTATVAANGNYLFDPGTNFQDLAEGETRLVSFTYRVTDDGTGNLTDDGTVNVTVTGTNDRPTIAIVDVIGSVTEDASTPNLTDNGSVTFTEFDATDALNSSVAISNTTTTGPAIPSALQTALDSALSLTQTGTNDGTIDWDFALANSLTQYLADGETITVTYTITVTDDSGTGNASATQDVTVTIAGTNDAPTISIDTSDSAADAFTVDGSSLSTSGTLTVADIDLTDTSNSTITGVVATGVTTGMGSDNDDLLAMLNSTINVLNSTEQTGSFTWDFDSGSETFNHLGSGEQLTLTYTIQVTDSQGATDTQNVTITITGPNNAPSITVETGNSESATLNETDTAVTSSGTLTITDPNLTDTVSATPTSVVASGTTSGLGSDNADLLAMFSSTNTVISDSETSGTLTWDFDSDAESFDYLADGESLTLTYTITATDSQGITDTHDVVITINGTNDAPIISGGPDTAALTETNSGLTTSGTMTVSDIDLSDVVMAGIDNVAVTGSGAASVPGTLTNTELQNFLSVSPASILNGTQDSNTMAWVFDSSTEAFDFLRSGDELILTYTVSVTDDAGTPLSDTETVTITITGTNDAPIAVVDTATAVEAGGDTNGTPGTNPSGNVLTNDNDADDGDTQTVTAVDAGTVVEPTGLVDTDIAGQYGSIRISSNGSYTYTVDNDNTTVEALRTASDTLTDVFSYTMTDADGSESTQQITVTIQGNNDAPRDLTATTLEVDENATAGTLVGTVTGTDIDAGNTLSYDLSDNAGGRFYVDSSGNIRVLDGTLLNYEASSTHTLDVDVTDTLGATYTETFTVTLNDLNEFSVQATGDDDQAQNIVDENGGAGITVGITVGAIDQDGTNNTVTHTLINDAGGRFAIDSATGEIVTSATAPLNYELDTQHTVEVRSESSDGSFVTQTYIIQIRDINEAPIANPDSFDTTAGQEVSLAVEDFTVNDTDVDSDTLGVVIVVAPNHGSLTVETDGSITYQLVSGFFGTDTFQYRADDGMLLSTETATVTVTVIADSSGTGSSGGSSGSGESGGTGVGEGEGSGEGEGEGEASESSESESSSTDSNAIGGLGPNAEDESKSSSASQAQRANNQSGNSGEDDDQGFSLDDSDGLTSSQGESDSELDNLLGRERFHGESAVFVGSAVSNMLSDILAEADDASLLAWYSRPDADNTLVNESEDREFVIGGVGTTLGLASIGYVLWALRGGMFMATMYAGIPSWRMLDPATLLNAYRNDDVAHDRVEELLD
ncbi:LamG-like jellyroll fold domain-containing protein [Neorhodopirellula lusitana]|uniref:LamG-like jellyroll fold domain-containing protein n=1 Tax=Neorhodopirellula lusitana TaxID=445327 RepID=UPI00384D1686